MDYSHLSRVAYEWDGGGVMSACYDPKSYGLLILQFPFDEKGFLWFNTSRFIRSRY
jgi:hypothetical protein